QVACDYAAWLVGRAGLALPAFTDPIAGHLAAMAAAFGARRDDEAIRLLEEALVRPELSAPKAMPLTRACFFGGAALPERIVEVALRLKMFQLSGQMLVGTRQPDRLLALFAARNDTIAVKAIGELVVHHRDAGAPHAAAEAAWAAIERA